MYIYIYKWHADQSWELTLLTALIYYSPRLCKGAGTGRVFLFSLLGFHRRTEAAPPPPRG